LGWSFIVQTRTMPILRKFESGKVLRVNCLFSCVERPGPGKNGSQTTVSKKKQNGGNEANAVVFGLPRFHYSPTNRERVVSLSLTPWQPCKVRLLLVSNHYASDHAILLRLSFDIIAPPC
jgi:hypothetical protein